jgi:hypothetical protein
MPGFIQTYLTHINFFLINDNISAAQAKILEEIFTLLSSPSADLVDFKVDMQFDTTLLSY